VIYQTYEIPHDRPVFLFNAPVKMQWGKKRMAALCEAAKPLDPAQRGMYLFFGANQARLKLVYFDGGYREITKWLPPDSCNLPAPCTAEPFSPIKRSMLDRILNIGNLRTSVAIMQC
jgi:IS66 Orf2 like protein